MASKNVRPDYYFKLDETAKKRYEEKLAVLKLSTDPFSLKENSFDCTKNIKKWSGITFADIFSYLINFPSMYTNKGLKAYKSLDSYKYVLSGLVFDVKVKDIDTKTFLVVGRV